MPKPLWTISGGFANVHAHKKSQKKPFAHPRVDNLSHNRLENRHVPAPRREHTQVLPLSVLNLQLGLHLAVPLLLGARFTWDNLPALLVILFWIERCSAVRRGHA